MRRSELTNALWKNVDFEACSWFIPAEDAKNKSAIKIPLSQQLLELFHQLRDEAKGSKYVLGGLAPASLSKALKRLQDSGRLDLAQPIRLHDLRRSYSTFLGDLGVQPHVIEKALNHSLEGVAAIYNRADLYSERATAIKLLSDALESPIQLLPAKQKID